MRPWIFRPQRKHLPGRIALAAEGAWCSAAAWSIQQPLLTSVSEYVAFASLLLFSRIGH